MNHSFEEPQVVAALVRDLREIASSSEQMEEKRNFGLPTGENKKRFRPAVA